jgi:low affinity Fe/Cu permease
MNHTFRKFSQWISERMGSPWAFVTAVLVIVIWAISGPFFEYSEKWQLMVNTGTTILTFLMVFLIQNTQNRDARATHLKLDELIKAIRPARNMLIDIEDMEDDELTLLQEEFKKFRDAKIVEIKTRKRD